MLFNSISFLIFLPIVFCLYWFILGKNYRHQNILILIASYVFYAWWDWRFLSLLLISSTVDYNIGRAMEDLQDNVKRKRLLYFSLLVNLSFLGFFKYYNFFIDSFQASCLAAGIELHARTLNIILPVGISFYTFQELGYIIDVYKKRASASRDAVSFFAFVNFFPHLVAGPIMRANKLIPQFEKARSFDKEKIADGLKQVLWGMAKKTLVADVCANNVDYIFANYSYLHGSTLLLGAIFFTFQLYCDFSGYSDIAVGAARMLGFELIQNFTLPYFSRDFREFWRRWNISISTWLRDYVFYPLFIFLHKKGEEPVPSYKYYFAILVTFLLSGLWHGANMTFVIWGFVNALYFLPVRFFGKQRIDLSNVNDWLILPQLKDIFKITTTFLLFSLSLVFFRSASIRDAFSYFSRLFSKTLFSSPVPDLNMSWLSPSVVYGLIGIAVLVAVEWLQRDKRHPLQFENMPVLFRRTIYLIFVFLIILYFIFRNPKTFIYFQF